MHRTGKLFATTMIAAAGAVSAALALSPSAAAQPAPAPAPAPAPGVPGLPFLQQLAANPAAATQLMQTFASALGNTTATAPAPVTTPPAATASITLPQTAANVLPAATTALPGPVPGTRRDPARQYDHGARRGSDSRVESVAAAYRPV